METLTKAKIVEILKTRVKNLIVSDLVSPLFWEDFASELFSLHEAEIAKWRELVKTMEQLYRLGGNIYGFGEGIASITEKSKLRDHIIYLEKELNLKNE